MTIHTSSRGASKVRSITRSVPSVQATVVSVLERSTRCVVIGCLLFRDVVLDLAQVLAQPVESLLEVAAVLLDPLGDVAQPVGLEATRAPLRLAALLDQPRALQHLEVLGDCGQAELERSRQLPDGRLALGQPSKNRSAGRVGERGKGCAERIGMHRRMGYPADCVGSSRNGPIVGTSQAGAVMATPTWVVPGSTTRRSSGSPSVSPGTPPPSNRNSWTACSGRISSESPTTTMVGAVIASTDSIGKPSKSPTSCWTLVTRLGQPSGSGATAA